MENIFFLKYYSCRYLVFTVLLQADTFVIARVVSLFDKKERAA